MSITIPSSEILDFICLLSQHRNLKVTVTESVKGAAITGTGAFVGSILGGPVGLVLGGAGAAVFAGLLSLGKYKSAITVIREDLDENQRRELAHSVWRVVRRIAPMMVSITGEALLTMVIQDKVTEGAVISVIQTFFKNINMQLRF